MFNGAYGNTIVEKGNIYFQSGNIVTFYPLWFADMTITLEEVELNQSLNGNVVAVPESRQLDVLADLLKRRGAEVLRIPLVTILDAPEQAPVERWLHQFITVPHDYFIVLTGEGLRRLRMVAERNSCSDEFVAALVEVCKICRGPKPGRVLKEMGLKPDMLGTAPTTPGIIAALDPLDLNGKRVAVQLYGENPNELLIDYLHERGAIISVVAPYIYAPDADEDKVARFISSLADGEINMMTFTSQPQLTRLQDVARKHNLEVQLAEGLSRIKVAAVGPIVADQLRAAGVTVAVVPESLFFMKPMVTALVRLVRSEG